MGYCVAHTRRKKLMRLRASRPAPAVLQASTPGWAEVVPRGQPAVTCNRQNVTACPLASGQPARVTVGPGAQGTTSWIWGLRVSREGRARGRNGILSSARCGLASKVVTPKIYVSFLIAPKIRKIRGAAADLSIVLNKWTPALFAAQEMSRPPHAGASGPASSNRPMSTLAASPRLQ